MRLIGTKTARRIPLALLLMFPPALLSAPPTARADAPAATCKLADIRLPRGGERRTDGDLPARFGRLLRSVAKEIKAPAGDEDAEVLTWTVKPGRARFTRTAIENALTEGGYGLADLSDAVRDTNPYDEERFGLSDSPVALAITDRRSFFSATNAAKRRTLLGIYLEGDERLALALLPVRFQPKAEDAPLPDVTGPAVVLVKDIRDAMQGQAPPKTPAFPKMTPKPRTVRGRVLNAAGRPIAGAQIVVQSSAAGGFRTDSRARTNAQGVYEVPLPVGVAQVVNADCTVRYNDRGYLLPLQPADGECEHFNGQDGHVENFTLRTYGAGPDAAQSPSFGTNYYGGHVRALWFNDDIPEGGTFELTFTPQGPLLGGVPARTLVFRFPNKGFGGEVFLNDLPLGRYILKARLFDGDALPLRMKPALGSDSPGMSLPVDFEPEGGNLATLGRSGVKRFDVMLKP